MSDEVDPILVKVLKDNGFEFAERSSDKNILEGVSFEEFISYGVNDEQSTDDLW